MIDHNHNVRLTAYLCVRSLFTPTNVNNVEELRRAIKSGYEFGKLGCGAYARVCQMIPQPGLIHEHKRQERPNQAPWSFTYFMSERGGRKLPSGIAFIQVLFREYAAISVEKTNSDGISILKSSKEDVVSALDGFD